MGEHEVIVERHFCTRVTPTEGFNEFNEDRKYGN